MILQESGPGGGAGEAAPVLIALGANLGDPRAAIREALERLGACVAVSSVSSLYRTAPVGPPDQPHFLNAVVSGETSLGPAELLACLKGIEREMGRTETVRNGPRVIDLDLLDRGGARLRSADLSLPHPRLHERGFVLVPLVEIAPGWTHPVLGRTAAELLASLPDRSGVTRLGPIAAPGPD